MPLIEFPGSDEQGLRFAIAAEGLYLANLLIAPGFAFLGLLWLWRYAEVHRFPLARQHLRQTIAASIWAGVLLIGLSAIILLIGGLSSMWGWLAVILYVIFFHSGLVLCGMVGLSRAMAGKPFRFPLIGPDDPE